MSLARQAHTIEYRRDKAKRADKWMTQSAEAAGIDLDDKDLYPCLLCVVYSYLFPMELDKKCVNRLSWFLYSYRLT